MFEHVQLHVSQAHLLERLHNRELNLGHEEIALHLLILVVSQSVQVRFQLLLELEVSDLCISVFHLAGQYNHWVFLGSFLRLFFFVVVIKSGPWIETLSVFG